MTPFLPPDALPVIFAALMAISVLAYVILDGYDLGVGMLLPFAADDGERDRMVASIGPFWDANETWLVLGVGLLLVAFPTAHGVILTALYLPVAFMLVGLTLRGVAFEFRAKTVDARAKHVWDVAFVSGSLIAALSQGWMVGRYILGFEEGWAAHGFAAMAAVGLPIAYCFLAAGWLIWRTEGPLQARAVRWARLTLAPVAFGIVLISVATPLASPRIFGRWFDFPNILYLAPLPLLTLALILGLHRLLPRLPAADDAHCRQPFLGGVALFILAFAGMAWSFFPYVVPQRMTLWEGGISAESLTLILVGAMVVLPMILAYTVIVWRIFGGKAHDLRYD